MRLLNTTSLKIEEFFGDDIPQYAILSHTWGRKEISYHEWVYAQNQSPPHWGWTLIPEVIEELKSRDGYRKIIQACQRARKDDYNWIWVDTICIDKTSSAELSEAINSMYQWYYSSGTCYAYLADVPNLSHEECSTQESPFNKSRWFTRGWTLQELLAPHRVEFYSRDWLYLSNKALLMDQIHIITGVPRDVITTDSKPASRSIAERMSWAANRTTTRIEDMAYCLLGIFDVSMPLIYGEGKNAFRRFQEEIIRRSSDQSFLVWRSTLNNGLLDYSRSLFAPSPAAFCNKVNDTEAAIDKWPFALNNVGLSMRVSLVRTLLKDFNFAVLSCNDLSSRPSAGGRVGTTPPHKYIWIPLELCDGVYERMAFPANYIRIAPLLPQSSLHPQSTIKACPDTVDIIIRADPATVGLAAEWGAEIGMLELLQKVSPAPRMGVLLTFPRGFCGWKVCHVFPDYCNINFFPPASLNDCIIWQENCEGTCDADHCTVEFAHPSNDTLTIRFVFATWLRGNGLWEPCARCASTGSQRTVLDGGSQTALGKPQNWSSMDDDDYAQVVISDPLSDFPMSNSSALSKMRIFVAQIIFKDPSGQWQAR